MIDSLIVEYNRLAKKRARENSPSNIVNVLKGLPIKGKILLLFLSLTGIATIILFELWWFNKSPNNYGAYLFYSVLAFASVFYSIYRYAMDDFEERAYQYATNYKLEILEPLKGILLRYDVFTVNKLNILVSQCDSKIQEARGPLKPLSIFLQIFFIPLLIASFQPFFTDKATAIKNSLSVGALGMAFYGFLYLIAPVKNLFESENVNRLKHLKKELQDIQIMYFH